MTRHVRAAGALALDDKQRPFDWPLVVELCFVAIGLLLLGSSKLPSANVPVRWLDVLEQRRLDVALVGGALVIVVGVAVLLSLLG